MAERCAVASFAVSDRLYTTDETPGGKDRQDLLFSPGVSLLFTDVFGRQGDLRVEYAYEDNNSNDDAHDYRNHKIKLSVAKRM